MPVTEVVSESEKERPNGHAANGSHRQLENFKSFYVLLIIEYYSSSARGVQERGGARHSWPRPSGPTQGASSFFPLSPL